MNVLVTLNSKYLKPLKVMLKSLFLNNLQETFTIYLMHSSIKKKELEDLDQYVQHHGSTLKVILMEDRFFQNAPILLHYTKEMYYRLLAFKFLPQDLERILYLDPDLLVINPVRGLYETDLGDNLYAAAYHDIGAISEINKIRFYPYGIEAYHNSGVLLMNLNQQRKSIDEKEIFEFVEKHRSTLIMPDQDIMNALYAKEILSLDEKIYNYDARYFQYYKLKTNGAWDMDYLIYHTVIIHFCGKKKPWHKSYNGKFHSLYKHYEKLALQINAL